MKLLETAGRSVSVQFACYDLPMLAKVAQLAVDAAIGAAQTRARVTRVPPR